VEQHDGRSCALDLEVQLGIARNPFDQLGIRCVIIATR
jgi:hypothetical protein